MEERRRARVPWMELRRCCSSPLTPTPVCPTSRSPSPGPPSAPIRSARSKREPLKDASTPSLSGAKSGCCLTRDTHCSTPDVRHSPVSPPSGALSTLSSSSSPSPPSPPPPPPEGLARQMVGGEEERSSHTKCTSSAAVSCLTWSSRREATKGRSRSPAARAESWVAKERRWRERSRRRCSFSSRSRTGSTHARASPSSASSSRASIAVRCRASVWMTPMALPWKRIGTHATQHCSTLDDWMSSPTL